MTSQSASNPTQLQALLVPRLKEAVDYVVQKIWNENRELIRVLIYESYQPSMYERTGEFKEAWDTDTTTSGNKVSGTFKYAPDKLTVNREKWQHGSSYISGGKEYETTMTTYLADVIYQGLSGPMFGQGPWTEKRDAWTALDKWLSNTQLRTIFEEGMSRVGIPWKRNVGAITVEKHK